MDSKPKKEEEEEKKKLYLITDGLFNYSVGAVYVPRDSETNSELKTGGSRDSRNPQ